MHDEHSTVHRSAGPGAEDVLYDRIAFLEARNAELEGLERDAMARLREARLRAVELGARVDALERASTELDAANHRYRHFFELAPIGYLSIDERGRLADLNLTGAELLGYSKAQLLRTRFSAHVADRDRRAVENHLHRVLTGLHDTVDLHLVRADHREVPVAVRSLPVDSPDGSGRRCPAAITDISEHRRIESELRNTRDHLQHLAHHDPLTDLPNRLLFNDRLEQAVQRAWRRGTLVALLFLDVDRFKVVNDALGHQAGDELLRELSSRIRGQVRREDTVARLGGDEFTVILENLEDLDDVRQITDKLSNALASPMYVAGQDLRPGVSIGVSLYPTHARSCGDLLRYADAAMYRAKEMGRGSVSFFTSELSADLDNRLEVERDLRRAVESGHLYLHYQPQLDARSGRLAGLEALARWEHPTRGLVMPDEFIGIAEESGIIDELGRWAVATACRQHARWRDQGLAPPPVAVNVSARQLHHPDLCGFISEVLRDARMPAEQLELELTESALLASPDVAVDVFGELRAMGVQIAIDDFGTGYSSLARLRHLPISKLKIDASFVRGLETRADDRAIASAIISMAHDLNLGVVSEGVETFGQREFLERSGCDFLQGFHLGRPVSGTVVREQLARA